MNDTTLYRIEPGWWFDGSCDEAVSWLKDAEELIWSMITDLSTPDKYKAKDILAALGKIREVLEEAEIIVEGEGDQ